ncbi:DNA polymerase III [archaeon]|jgi:DNA polymerase (family 10)|nr:DNA polymerase III [archaeon]MDP6547594.1 DNA polymerase/3'-5' exonuclease PolX [Candidatus Woesearchaeota archaeon]|tara:strand:+ start:34016 stop:35728 length:1713 start_codon:yes stop_codon:yes gene_type:complete
MKNFEVAELLRNIAQLLEIKNEIVFKIRAYEKAALVIENLEEDIADIWKKGKLRDIPGVGEALTEKISEFLDTGKLGYYEELKNEVPVKIEELGKVPGLGPKTIMKLYKELDVKNIKDLERAAKQRKIEKIEGLGIVVEENILKSIKFAKESGNRFLLGHVLDIAEDIKNKLIKLNEINKIEIAGSLRRKKETIGDIDILVTSKNPSKVMGFFTGMSDVKDVLAKGHTKSSVRLSEGLQVDLRIVDEKSYGAALLYFTGSKQHNITLRKIAIKKGMKLSEYGIFNKKTDKMLAGKTEKDCYKKLGLSFIEPEIREEEGEIEAAQKGKLPKFIGYNDIKCDLQMHTKYSDGNNTIMEMAEAAKKLGHEYICITDHTGNLKIANAMDEKRIKKQRKEIDKINDRLKNFRILQGAEVNIKADGNLDMKDNVLKEFDVVLAAVHSGFKNSKEKITNRIIKAMENEHADIIAHPFGRLLNKRPAYDMDFEKVLEKARETNTVLEVNAYPERLDLNDIHVRAAIKAGVKLSIGTDAHDAEQLRYYKLGIATARRGWAGKNDVVNTYSVKDMLGLLK